MRASNHPEIQIDAYLNHLKKQLDQFQVFKFKNLGELQREMYRLANVIAPRDLNIELVDPSKFSPSQKTTFDQLIDDFTKTCLTAKKSVISEMNANQAQLFAEYIKQREEKYSSSEFLLSLQGDSKEKNRDLNKNLYREFKQLRDELSQIKLTYSYEKDKKICDDFSGKFPGWNTTTLFNRLLEEVYPEKQIPKPEVNIDSKALHEQLENLYMQGYTKLNNSKSKMQDQIYGQVTCDLALELMQKAHDFFDHPKKVADPKEQEKFQKEFHALLHSQDKVIKAHSAQYKKVIANIVKCLALTLSLMGIPIFVAVTKQNPLKYFNDVRTNREKTVANVDAIVANNKFKPGTG